ncbi:MAG: glycolate oxidase subunit GlcE [Gammaproteobacteria bacterium]|nr:glycolate oxidase subunit GlcE [Gammaproteobacteria bacterium]MYF38810.1 glycolate oxidase subunit GlcE [Gammaproteobacteria bacterium]
MSEQSSRLYEAVNTALAQKQSVRIIGDGSKSFLYVGDTTAPLLNVSDHKGVIEYRPEELVITVRAGTRLSELKDIVASQGQMWACDPPQFDGRGTVGGAIASGLCGPGRPWFGSLRDSLLGVELINGFGDSLRFGGKVIKNVAGFDVSRLLAGSQGTLGIVLSASLKLLPLPEQTRSIAVSCSSHESASVIAQYTKKTSTLTGTCYFNGTLYLRFSGVAAAVENDMRDFTSSTEIDPKFWQELRDHSTTFFADDVPLWRITLSRGSWYHEEDPDQSTASLAEWNGTLLWYKTENAVRPNLSMTPYSVCSFRNVKHKPVEPSKYSLRIKHAFDPQNIFNPGVVL